MKTASLASIFGTLTAFQSAAVSAGYNSRISAAGKASPNPRILEQPLLQGETTCTRTNFLGNITTVCDEASDIQSYCKETPEGMCEYAALDLTEFVRLLEVLFNSTNSTDGDVSVGESSSEDAFATVIFAIVVYIIESKCQCTDSNPDCRNVANLTDYSFNACAAVPKYSRTCKAEGGSVCCDVVDEKGEMKCCRSNTETETEYECVSGSDTGKITLSDTSCVATHNRQPCTCELCTGPDRNTTTITAYDCTDFGGTKRICPDMGSEEFALSFLEAFLGDPVERSLQYTIVDPRTESGAANASLVRTVVFAISSIVTVGLLY